MNYVTEKNKDDRRVEWENKENKFEEKGVFFLTRKEQIEVLATMVPSAEYAHPEVKAAMEDELAKWERFEAYEVIDDNGQDTIDGR